MAVKTGNDDVRSTSLGMVLVPVRVTFGDTGAPTLGYAYGAVTSVTRDAAGRYSIVFSDQFRDLLGIAADGHDYQGTATDGQWQIYTGYVASTGTVVLSHAVAGTETDPASGNQVDIVFFMRNTDAGVF